MSEMKRRLMEVKRRRAGETPAVQEGALVIGLGRAINISDF
jgi:hypothetical protein